MRGRRFGSGEREMINNVFDFGDYKAKGRYMTQGTNGYGF